jgi:hypothetical protein
LLLVTALLVFTACSDSKDSGQPASASSSAGPATKPAVVNKTTDPPRTANYVGARKDVTNLSCKQDGQLWRVSGTVTNPTDAPVDYRIFTSFLDSSNETRGLLQTDVAGVAPAEARDWSGEIELDAADLICGLRVERTGVNGAPPPTDPASSG